MKQRNNDITLAPTDLANFLSCRHLTSMDLAAVNSLRARRADALAEIAETYLNNSDSSGSTA